MGISVDGIVDETRFCALVFNGPAETLLASFERQVAKLHIVRSVYVRRRSEIEYRKLFGPDDFTSAWDVVTAEAAPIAYFLIWTHARGRPSGLDWKALARIDLETLVVSEVITSFAGDWEGTTISRLHAASADGTSLVCTVGRPKPRSGANGEGGGYTMEYMLCHLDMAAIALEPLTMLRNAFF